MHNLFPPLIAENVTTPQGPLEVGVVAGAPTTSSGSTSPTVRCSGAGGSRTGWPIRHRRQRALPRRTDGRARDGAGISRQIRSLPCPGTAGCADQPRRRREFAPPEKFIPGNGKPYALNYKDGVIYTATAQGCGGLTNAFHSFDLASRRASTFIPAGGGCGAAVAQRSMPKGASISEPATRCSIREIDGRATASSGEDRREEAASAGRLLPPRRMRDWMWRRTSTSM